MKRKLIQLSPSTKVVSLPSKWVRENKFKKGQDVNLDIEENRVIISAVSDKAKKEIKMDLSGLDGKMMWVVVDSMYVAGYDSIIMKTSGPRQTAKMTKVVRYFPGMIIVEERKDRVHFKAMAEMETDLDKILNRVFNMMLAMVEDSVDGIKNKDWALLADMKRRDWVINSYVSLCLRAINKFGYKQFSKTGIAYSYLNVVETLADKLAALFVAMGVRKKADAKTAVLIQDMVRHVQKVHFKYSLERLLELEKMRDGLTKRMGKTPSQLLPYLSNLVGVLFDLEELEMQLNV